MNDQDLEARVDGTAVRTRRLGTEAASRARVEERLRNLESELSEVKSRLNGLLFFIASTVLAQVVLRLVA
jgi:hypothetical protein